MPCENCQAQFTVFRRKRSCSDCRRFYCSNCLNAVKRVNGLNLYLCRRCSIFAKRPLLRSDLMQLKPKDLIFYLQSKQISIAGCVEKDELINLVLAHAEQVDNLKHNIGNNGSANMNTNNVGQENIGNDTTNSFEGIKQTCQNFFSNLSENITETFATFDTRKPQSPNLSTTSSPTVDQPRVFYREMPSYASSQARMESGNNSHNNNDNHNNNANNININITTTISTSSTTTTEGERGQERSAGMGGKTNTTTVPNTSRGNQSPNAYQSSPSFSVSSSSSVQVSNHEMQNEPTSSSTLPTDTSRKDFDLKSDCECSDEDIMLNFSERHSLKTDSKRKANHTNTNTNTNTNIDPFGPSTSKAGSQSSKLDVYENCSHSSFEELGAIGGDEDVLPISSSILSLQTVDADVEGVELEAQEESYDGDVERPTSDMEPTSTIDLPTVSTSTSQDDQPLTAQISNPNDKDKPKVQRRRSDSYLTRRRALSAELSPTSPTTNRRLENSILPFIRQHNSIQELEEAQPQHDHEHDQQQQQQGRPILSCTRCGKNKANLRRHVQRMRRHLQNSQMSDEDIKREMNEFLEFLENRQRSMDQSDNDTVQSSTSGVFANQLTLESPSEDTRMDLDENEGIHVYATNGLETDCPDSRFINIDVFKEIEDLEMLTVKELKQILMLHRVDYKGCCEKQELLERVQRLWKTLKATPAVDKLPTDEICKICMDAPIECVILECGHMATCTSCGKVLSECPICRQYIVRVVRFFRA